MIIDGKIKLKADSEIENFTKKGLKFKDGSELEADGVIFATGFVFPLIFLLDSLLTWTLQLWRHSRHFPRTLRRRDHRQAETDLGNGRRRRAPGSVEGLGHREHVVSRRLEP
jgi:hypothetical protein